MAESSKTHHFIPVIIFPSKVDNIEWAWSKIFEFSNFDDGILEQVGWYSTPSAK